MASQLLDSKTPFADLLFAVFNSILEVFILCLAGYILARRGIFDKKTQKQINRLNVSLFTPALLFSKVAYFLTPEKLKEYWIIPIWFAVVTASSMFVGYILSSLFHLRQSQKSFVMAAAMFMNSNSLPIALMQSLVFSVPDLAWGSADNEDAMLGRALTYLTMYSILGMVLRYSFGVTLLSRADTIQVQSVQSESDANNETPLHLPPSRSAEAQDLIDLSSTSTIDFLSSEVPQLSTHSRPASPLQPTSTSPEPMLSRLPDVIPPLKPNKSVSVGSTTIPRPFFSRTSTFYNSFPNTPSGSMLTLGKYDPRLVDSDSDTDTEDGGEIGLRRRLPIHSSVGVPQVHHSSIARGFRYVRRLTLRVLVAIGNFMTAPLWSAFFSLVVAFIEPVKHALEHHLQPLNGAINTAGKCAVPLTLVVLGAYFHNPSEDGTEPKTLNVSNVSKIKQTHRTIWQHLSELSRLRLPQSPTTQKPDERPRPGETKAVILAVLARMIITPILLAPLLVLAATFDWHAIFEDPVFVTVNTILLCSPPAITLAQITAAVSGDALERLISRTIFWSYCIVTPPVTMGCVMLGLWLSKA